MFFTGMHPLRSPVGIPEEPCNRAAHNTWDHFGRWLYYLASAVTWPVSSSFQSQTPLVVGFPQVGVDFGLLLYSGYDGSSKMEPTKRATFGGKKGPDLTRSCGLHSV